MTKLLTATYQGGVLRPDEPLSLPDGASVRIAVVGPGVPPATAEAWDAAAAIAAARAIAALPLEGRPARGEAVGRDHDRYLYGDRSEFGRGPAE